MTDQPLEGEVRPAEGETPQQLMRPIQAAKDFEPYMLRRQEMFEELLEPVGLPFKRFLATVTMTLAKDDKIRGRCSVESILMSCLDAARMGLEPTGAYGGAYLINRKGQAVLEVDYRGFIRMGMREGAVSKVHTAPVYLGDEFYYQEGTDPKIHHIPTLGKDWEGQERGDMTHAYGVAWFPNGDYEFTVMTMPELDAIMNRTSSKKDGKIVGPWVSDPVAMRLKTTVRKLFKMIPAVYNPALAYALEREDRFEGTAEVSVPVSSRRAGVLASLTGQTPEALPEGEPDPATATDSEEGLPE